MHILLAGRATALTKEQEDRLLDYILTMASIGYGLCKKEIPDVVKGFIVLKDLLLIGKLSKLIFFSRFIYDRQNVNGNILF